MNNSFPQFIPMPVAHGQNKDCKHHNMAVYIDSSPYPEVTKCYDPETVAMLKEDYAGAAGELTAITQYVFQNGRSEDKAFANAMLQIAIVEMMHLDMLGDAIVALGGDPCFCDGRHYWNASYVNYEDCIQEMLKADIKSEKTAIETYQKQAACIRNPSVKALIERIIKDEKLHLCFFMEMLESFKYAEMR